MQITFLPVQKAKWQAIAMAKRIRLHPYVLPIRERIYALPQGAFCVLLKSSSSNLTYDPHNYTISREGRCSIDYGVGGGEQWECRHASIV